jgi:hypothetical protein
MNEQKTLNCRWHLGMIFAIVALGAFAVLLTSSKPVRPKLITISMDTNGTARIGGVPLANTNIRDAAFAAMGVVGLKAGLAVPAAAFTNKTQESNMLETLQSMTRAGLFSTNQPPNPYE